MQESKQEVSSLVLQIRAGNRIIKDFPKFSIKTYFVTHHYNRLFETVLMRGHNICFH